jgi:hypothetical protein
MKRVDLYRTGHFGWNVKHFHAWYTREHDGQRGYTWVKNKLQQAGAVTRAKARGQHRKKRDREPLPGMMLHQDASDPEWIPDHRWDLVVTMDDATGDHLSMFFCDEEGTASGITSDLAHTLSCYSHCRVQEPLRGVLSRLVEWLVVPSDDSLPWAVQRALH